MLGLSVSTVQKLVTAGRLQAWRTGGGHRRIVLQSVEQELSRLRDPEVQASPRALRVMVVEDNRVATAAYARMFAQWGGAIEPVYLADGAQALLKIGEFRPDVLITDLQMGPVDGRLLIKTLRAQAGWTHLKVVVVSGALGSPEPDPAADARTVVYAKPLSFERLAGYLDAQVQNLALATASAPRAADSRPA